MDPNFLTKLYGLRYHANDLSRKNAIWKVLCNNFFQKYINKTDIVIDVACGHREFINNIIASNKIAIDLNPESKKFLDSSINFYQLSASNISQVGEGIADVLFVSNFLEHLRDKTALEEFYDQVLSLLKPGGKFMILGPNLRYMPGKYWDYYDHFLGLTHFSLIESLELHGFKIILCIDKFLPHSDRGKSLPHPILPWGYLKFPFVWKIMGKQFFIICEKI